MLVSVKTTLNCPATRAWAIVQKPKTLLHVTQPLAYIKPAGAPFPAVWKDRETYFCKSYLFGFIPLGKRKIFLERVDASQMQIQSRETDALIQRWDHLISISPIDTHQCLYSDEIEVEAGWLTLGVWLWANWFYRHRQGRLRNIVVSLS